MINWLLSCEQEIVQEDETISYDKVMARAKKMAEDHGKNVYLYEKFPDGELIRLTTILCIPLESGGSRSEPPIKGTEQGKPRPNPDKPQTCQHCMESQRFRLYPDGTAECDQCNFPADVCEEEEP